METHDQSSHSCHVVHVGKGNEGDCCHVVQEHDQKILGTQLSRRAKKKKESHNWRKNPQKCLMVVWVTAWDPEHLVQYRHVTKWKWRDCCVHIQYSFVCLCVSLKMSKLLLLTNINRTRGTIVQHNSAYFQNCRKEHYIFVFLRPWSALCPSYQLHIWSSFGSTSFQNQIYSGEPCSSCATVIGTAIVKI